MGAVLSLPVQLAGNAVASCFGASVSSVLCSATGSISSAVGARFLYALLFLLNSLLAWLSLSDWAVSKLDILRYACGGDECTGFVAVIRICCALGGLHLLMAGLLGYVESTPGGRPGTLQNSWWRMKLLVWLTGIVVNFLFIPAGVWVAWGNWGAPLLSFIFVFIGLVLLVDAAHSWAALCLEHMEESEDEEGGGWKYVLVGSTLSMYVGAFVLTGIMLWFFADSGCNMNQAAITLNLIGLVITSVLSIHPTIQESNSRAGLAQSAMVGLYCTYLTMSAVSAEPDDRHCNPLVRSKGTRTLSIVLGAIFSFLAIAYTTMRAASRSTSSIDPEDQALRQRALQQAINDGTLPESALDDSAWEDDEGYSYVLFHIVFLLATQYTATLLTMNVDKDPTDDFVPVGRTYFAAWVKIVSSWICYGLYGWSLLAPVVMPDRF